MLLKKWTSTENQLPGQITVYVLFILIQLTFRTLLVKTASKNVDPVMRYYFLNFPIFFIFSRKSAKNQRKAIENVKIANAVFWCPDIAFSAVFSKASKGESEK